MRIYELLWFLCLLHPASVDLAPLASCPHGCRNDGHAMVCTEITNKDLANLYHCLQTHPTISILDIKSKLECDCELLYLTNHHINEDLLVFAPVDCPPGLPEKCGFAITSDRYKHANGAVEVGGKMFKPGDKGLKDQLNTRLTRVIQNLKNIKDPKERLKYLKAVYYNAQQAMEIIDKMDPHATSVKPLPISTPKPVTTPPPALKGKAFAPMVNYLQGKDWKNHRGAPPHMDATMVNQLHKELEKNGAAHKGTVSPAGVQKKPVHHLLDEDQKKKLIIFGCIIAFLVFVVMWVLIAMKSKRQFLTNKPSGGDLEISHYWRDKTVWKKLKGTVQTEYKRRVEEEEIQGSDSSMILTTCDLPKSNLVSRRKNGDCAAVSGLTTAIPQQPVIKQTVGAGRVQQSSPSKPGKLHKLTAGPEAQTRLLYRAGLYPGSSDDSVSVGERAVPSPSPHHGESSQTAATSDNLSLDSDMLPENLERTTSHILPVLSPINGNDLSPVSSDEGLEKQLFLVKYGHKSGYSVTQDVKGKVKVYQPANISKDVPGGMLLKMEDTNKLDALNKTMTYAAREKARLARKKRLARLQIFTG